MARPRSIQCISRQCQAILDGKTRLNPQVQSMLKPHKRDLKSLASPRTSIRTKRKILNQKGGFLGTLLGALASGVIGPLIGALKR